MLSNLSSEITRVNVSPNKIQLHGIIRIRQHTALSPEPLTMTCGEPRMSQVAPGLGFSALRDPHMMFRGRTKKPVGHDYCPPPCKFLPLWVDPAYGFG